MSRSRQRVNALQQISVIRAVSTNIAQSKCVAAAKDAIVAQDRQVQQLQHLRDVISGWEEVMAAAYFDPASTTFWGHAINFAASGVDNAIRDTKECTAILEIAEKNMAGMIANERCAEALLSKAKKKHFGAVENRHLAEQADQITRLEMRKW